jgi:hypothetical protein
MLRQCRDLAFAAGHVGWRRKNAVLCSLHSYAKPNSMPKNRFASAAPRARCVAAAARAKQKAMAALVITELRASGIARKRSIAMALNEHGIQTPRSFGGWHRMQVRRLQVPL